MTGGAFDRSVAVLYFGRLRGHMHIHPTSEPSFVLALYPKPVETLHKLSLLFTNLFHVHAPAGGSSVSSFLLLLV